MSVQIYHNPRCRKSREALQLLESRDVEIEVIRYLDETPSRVDFKKVLAKLGMQPSDLIRRGESIFKEKFKTLQLNEEEWLDILLENPKLIERPIVIDGNKAAVGRPLEQVIELLDRKKS